jgi:hypothetical protein
MLETQKVNLDGYAKLDFVNDEVSKINGSLSNKISKPDVGTHTRVPSVTKYGVESYESLTHLNEPSTLIQRDDFGRAEISTPQNLSDIANKGYVDSNFSNALKGTESGATVSMDDVSPVPHKVKAKTSSKNPLCVDANGYSQHVTVNVLDNNSFTMEINGEHEAPLYEFWTGELEHGDYILSCNVDIENNTTAGRPNEILYFCNGEVRHLYAIGNTFPHTVEFQFYVPNNKHNRIVMAFYANVKSAEYNNYKATFTNVQLKKGTVATEFTPYVADDTEITVKSCGKNLCNIPSTTVGGTGSWTYKKVGDFLLPNGNYTLSCDYEQKGDVANVTLSPRKLDGTAAQLGYAIGKDQSGKMSVVFTITDECKGGMSLYVYSNESANVLTTECEFKNIQIEKGTVATEYEPYALHETVTTTVMQGAELNSVAPNMTIVTDTQGVVINAEYNKDTNKVIEKLTQSIISLGGNI